MSMNGMDLMEDLGISFTVNSMNNISDAKNIINELNKKQEQMKKLTLFFSRYIGKYVIISDNSSLKEGKIIYMKSPEVGLIQYTNNVNLILTGIQEYFNKELLSESDSAICINCISTISESFDSLEQVLEYKNSL